MLSVETIIEKYKNKIKGVLSCYDRIIITGSLLGFNYSQGMTSYLFAQKIRIFDYPKFAAELRDEIRINAEKIAQDSGIKIEYIKKSKVRKEAIIQKKIKERGNQHGLVHILSVMESCHAYKPWHDKITGKNYLKPDSGKCLHYYFYLIDEILGLCYIRVPTWCPFRLQIYCNGHHILSKELNKKKIEHKVIDNAFVDIADFDKAQKLSDEFKISKLHRRLDIFAKQFCPIIKRLNLEYHWSIMQAEYSTDIIFKQQADLNYLYETISRTAIHAVKAENIATFLGKKLSENYQDEMGNNFNTRIEGTRIKHSMGDVSIKIYDKFSLILRIETTVNDLTFFKHYREVVHKNGEREMKLAPLKKGLYSLGILQKHLFAANKRYLEFISSLEDRTIGKNNLNKISETKVENNHSYKGFNFFNDDDVNILLTIIRGEFAISGFKNFNLRDILLNKNTGQISRMIKRLMVHGVIKKIYGTYKYYITTFGREIIATAQKIKEFFIIPNLCFNK